MNWVLGGFHEAGRHCGCGKGTKAVTPRESPGSFRHSLDQKHGGSVSINLTSEVRAGLLGI